MKASEIRTAFLKYFEKNGHTVVESSSLIPQNDPTLLFTNAGMVQFKDVFTGREKRPYSRATTAQKCVRAGGKHNDLENVGFTARHHTFFEMLGNFSFGDYFKKDAIRFAWEFITKELKIPKDRLYVTVHTTDDEAADLWHKQESVPRDRISRFDEDNFWAMGDTGPCGPCTEIFVDRGKQHGCGKPDCKVGCNCDRFMEIWNLVFMQFERSADGKTKPLPKPSVDTGAGLERLASTLQNVNSNYEIDLFRDLMKRAADIARKPLTIDPSNPDTVALRVIADHSRATAFLMGDGVLPSNEGRGYVLRRIMRRAIRYGKKLGLNDPFLFETASFVVDQMKTAYPDLESKRVLITRAVKAEEEQFFRTLERGLELLDTETKSLSKGKALSGGVAFKLYDTYGFPLDLTRVILTERGLSLDEKGFEQAMEKQRDDSRKSWKGSGDQAVDPVFSEVANALKTKNKLPEFTGYEKLEEESPVTALVARKGDALVSVDRFEFSSTNKTVFASFEKTPFYGEGGGQMGDRGEVRGPGGTFRVVDCTKPLPELTFAVLEGTTGSIAVGQKVHEISDKKLRAATARNHTATHLLHWALRSTLGDHVKQAGSLVNSDLLRFDFSHFQPLTTDELTTIENKINERIWSADPVSKAVMAKDEAVKKGAIAFFGEKYGDQVRVIQVGSVSTELCGGTHVSNAEEIHCFKIVSESGIAAGVRRIIAYTSEGAFRYLRDQEATVRDLRTRVKASSNDEIAAKIDKMRATEKELTSRLEKLESKNIAGDLGSLIERAEDVRGTLILVEKRPADAGGGEGMKNLRELSEQLRNKEPRLVSVLGMEDTAEGKALIVIARGAKVPGAVTANGIIQKVSPLIDGRGGGKPELAQAGGGKLAGLDSALSAARKAIEELLS